MSNQFEAGISHNVIKAGGEPVQHFEPQDLLYPPEGWNPKTATIRVKQARSLIEAWTHPANPADAIRALEKLQYRSDAQRLLDGQDEFIYRVFKLDDATRRDLGPNYQLHDPGLLEAEDGYKEQFRETIGVIGENRLFIKKLIDSGTLLPDPETTPSPTSEQDQSTQARKPARKTHVGVGGLLKRAAAPVAASMALLFVVNGEARAANGDDELLSRDQQEAANQFNQYDLNNALRTLLESKGINPEQVADPQVASDEIVLPEPVVFACLQSFPVWPLVTGITSKTLSGLV